MTSKRKVNPWATSKDSRNPLHWPEEDPLYGDRYGEAAGDILRSARSRAEAKRKLDQLITQYERALRRARHKELATTGRQARLP